MKNISAVRLFFYSLPLAFFTQVRAQYDAMFTQYMFNEMFINPAYAGSKEAMSSTLLHRQQWVGFPGRPNTTSFSLHGPVQGNKMGLGLSVLNEKIGILNRTLLYGSYSYRIKINDNNSLSMGLMGGLENQQNNFEKVIVSNDGTTDPQFAHNTSNVVAPNFGAGLYYRSKNYYVGVSIPRMVNNEIKFNSGGSTIKVARISADKFTYYLTGGYLFTVNEELKLRTNAMIKVVKNAPSQFELGGNLLIRDMIWTGLAYRSKSSISALLGIQANKQLLISYSYDFGVNKIQRYSQGSHEVAVNYLFSFTSKKVITPRYF
jgi:type IX secretion system PorP/SprF family membrane protein